MKTAIQVYEDGATQLKEFFDKYSKTIMETIADPDLSQLLTDLGGTFDSITEIPLFSVITAPFAVEAFFFMKKVRRFLLPCESVSPQERLQFIDSLERDKKRKRVGEVTFTILQKLDDEVKASLLGNMFRAYIKGLIDFSAFRKLSAALVRIMTHHLKDLVDYYNDQSVSPEALQDIAMCGLAELPPAGVAFYSSGDDGSKRNDFGRQFVKMTKLEEELKDGLIDDYGLY